MFRPRGAHLVGSVPLDDTEAAFRLATQKLGIISVACLMARLVRDRIGSAGSRVYSNRCLYSIPRKWMWDMFGEKNFGYAAASDHRIFTFRRWGMAKRRSRPMKYSNACDYPARSRLI